MTAPSSPADRPAPVVRLERIIAADPARVYAAWTEPAVLDRWFCPNPDLPLRVTADVVIGGRFRVDMGEGAYVAEGTYTELDPPRVVAFTWRWATDPAGTASHVRVELAAEGTSTRLVLVHSGLTDEADAVGHQEGWELELGRLAQVV